LQGFGGVGARAPPRRFSYKKKNNFHVSIMSLSDAKLAADPSARPRAADVPSWVTDDLIRRTIAVWQPYYRFSLTREDAVGMILAVGRLFGVLSRS
jgi:hypothetical protein